MRPRRERHYPNAIGTGGKRWACLRADQLEDPPGTGVSFYAAGYPAGNGSGWRLSISKEVLDDTEPKALVELCLSDSLTL